MTTGRIFDVALPPTTLEAGGRLQAPSLRGWTWGPADAPVILLIHALTGDADATGLWGPLIGPGRPLDPTKFRLLCFNNLGGCSGSTGPTDVDFPTRADDARFGPARTDAPGALPSREAIEPATVTTWDQARAILQALDVLGIDRLHLVTGGSLGGAVALALAVLAPERTERLALFATCAASSSWIVGWNHIGRQAILADPTYPVAANGLAIARQVAHLTYRAEPGLELKQGRAQVSDGWSSREAYRVQTYLQSRGEQLVQRFDAPTYLCQLGAMDHHDVERRPPADFYAGVDAPVWGLARVCASTLAVAVPSDQLYLPSHCRTIVDALSAHGARAVYAEIDSPHGHDAFLIEWDQMAALLARALALPAGVPFAAHPAGTPMTADCPSTYRVMKFGGSSLGDPERLVRVVGIIGHEHETNGPVAIVVSAFGDTTERLLSAVTAAAAGHIEPATQIADAISQAAIDIGTHALQGLVPGADAAPVRAAVYERVEALRSLLFGVSLVREMTPQTVDSVVSFGERIASAVVAAVLTVSGRPAVAVDARSWTVTDDAFGAALVDWEATQSRLDALAPTWGGRIPVHTGFIGATPDGRTTTLGRNGSDYTATLLARGLQAREVVRWTDVSGVMTADPDLVDDAYPIAHLTYAEALELANFGAKVFHQRTMIPLMDSGIPMRIRDTMAPDAPGTLIDARGAADAEHATSVTSLENLALIGVQWRRLPEQARMGERVLRALDEADVTVWMANQAAHGQSVAVVVPSDRVDRACDAIRRALRDELARGDLEALSVRTPVTLLSLVAEVMGRTPNVAGRFFGALGSMGVNVLAIAQGASARSVSAVIGADDTAVAVRTVHAAFNFSHQEVNLLLVGCGTVGSALIDQIRSQRDALLARQDVRLRIVGIANSKGVVFDPSGIDLDSWRDRLATASGGTLDDAVVSLSRLPVPILVDCTASADIINVMQRGFAHGVHAAAANKKPFAADRAAYAALFAAARAHHRDLRYETTVGASLPVIETLKDLVRTGDVVHRIEGSFSGTLGFVCNELSAGVPIHVAVAEARRLGYTEPNPAEDLNGQDVARKALILARELGIDADLADVIVEPLVPSELLQSRTADELLARLADAAPGIAARVASLAAEGKQLRYLARIVLDDGPPRIEVGPVGVAANHPAARLVGTEAFVAFTTERHAVYPLLVQGAGAGAQVTASGVLADVLGIARSARGR